MTQKNQSKAWLDAIIMFFSLALIGVSLYLMVQNGFFNAALSTDKNLLWHLVRSAGLVAYLLLLAATIWGLFISSQFVKNWAPGPVAMTVHSTISWLALLLGLVHALLLRFDDYFAYSFSDIFIPFTGPYRPIFVGLGTLAFWILLVVTLSFPLKKAIGHKTWKLIHYLSYLAFVLVSVHGLFAGTDGTIEGFRILVAVGIGATILLLGIRMGKDQTKNDNKARRGTANLKS